MLSPKWEAEVLTVVYAVNSFLFVGELALWNCFRERKGLLKTTKMFRFGNCVLQSITEIVIMTLQAFKMMSRLEAKELPHICAAALKNKHAN